MWKSSWFSMWWITQIELKHLKYIIYIIPIFIFRLTNVLLYNIMNTIAVRELFEGQTIMHLSI